MKWIGQHIWDFVSRFRNDIYFEGLAETAETRGLVVDANGKVSINPASGEEYATHIYENVRNDEGSTIPVGTPVYSKGEIGGSERIKVGIADASDPTKMPAIGITDTELTTTGSTKDGRITLVGVYNTNLSGFSGVSENDIVYVAIGGGLTITKPTGVNLIQNVGIVLKTNGPGTIIQGLQVTCIGRTNDVPTPLYIDHANQRLGIGTTSPLTKLHVSDESTPEVRIQDTTNDRYLSLYQNNSNSYIQTSLNSPLVFSTHGSNERMRITTAGNVGIGTTSPAQKLHVNGNIRVGNSTDAFYGNRFTALSNADVELRSNNGYDLILNANAGDNVGIGTTSPSQKLHVIGDARIQGNLTVNGTYTQIDTDVNTTEQWLVTNDGTGPAAIINQLGSQDIFDVQDDGTSVFYIEDGGNVGIGTTSPSEILHLESTAPKIKLSNSQNSTGYYTTLEQNYSYNGPSFAINSVSGATARTLFGRYANNVSILPTGTGNVGIGTSSPSQKLDVVGSVAADTFVSIQGIDTGNPSAEIDELRVSGYGVLGRRNSGVYLSNEASGPLHFGTGGRHAVSTRMTIDSSGNVGIGTSSPARRLEVFNSSSSMIGQFKSGSGTSSFICFANTASTADQVRIGSISSNLVLSTNYTERMRIDSSGNVGVGTTSPGYKFVVNSSTADTVAKFESTDSIARLELKDNNDAAYVGTQNNKAFIGMEANATGTNNLIVASDGNVGIGTTSPDSKLHVYGTSNPVFKVEDDGGAWGFMQAAGSNQVYVGSGPSANLSIYAGLSSAMTILASNRNVGIGNTNPGYKLDVSSGSAVGARISTSGFSNLDLVSSRTSGNLGGIRFKQDVDTYQTGEFLGLHGGGFEWKTGNGTALPSTRMVLDTSGNVGIGTTSPSEKLHVFGGAAAIKIDSTTNEASLKYDNSTTTATIKLANNDLKTELGGSEVMRVLANGNVGIGTTSPSGKLHISSGGSPSIIIQDTDGTDQYATINHNNGSNQYIARSNTSNGQHVWFGQTGPSSFNERMRIDSSGNVGIGTASPAYKLDVVGGGLKTTTATGNRITYYDGSGINAYGSSGGYAINNHNGNLSLVQNVDDGDIIFKSDDGSGGVETYFFLDGSEGVVNFPDNKRLTFGTGRDLFLYHDGANATFKNYVGDIVIQNEANDKDIIFKSDDGSGGIAEYFRVDGSNEQVLFNKEVRLNDSVSLKLGSFGDLQMYHDGSNSYMRQVSSGNLYIDQLVDDSDIVIRSDDGSGGLATYLQIDGSAEQTRFFKDTRHTDGIKSNFGNGDDLQIYHDGSNSYIDDTGTGDLRVRTTNGAAVKIQYGAENMIQANANSSVDLYYDNSKKLETTSTGIEVTGDIAVSGSVQRQISTSTHTINFGAAGSATQNYFLPFVQQAEQAAPNNTHRMVVPYDGIIKKVIVHSKVAFGSSAAVRYHRIDNGNTTDFANDGSTDDVTTDVSRDMSTAYAAGVFNFTTGNTFSAGDQIALSFVRGNTALGDVVVTVVYEYELF